MDSTTTARSQVDRLATDTRDLATHLAALERHVEVVVDPIAATHARTALRELEALAELLEDPELEVRR